MGDGRTPEGLVIEETHSEGHTTVRERTPDGYLVHKYERVIEGDLDGSPIWTDREEPYFMIGRLHDLEERCASGSDGPAARNLEIGRRRLRRWHREWGTSVLRLSPELEAVARRALEVADPELSDAEIAECIATDEFLLAEYYRRKASTSPLILRVVPAHLPPLIEEAKEAFAHGLWRSSIGLCRCILEDVVKRVVRAQMHRTEPPRNWRDFHMLLKSVPEDVLPARERNRTLELYEQGNQALHSAKGELTGDLTRRVLKETGELVEVMIRSNGLHQRPAAAMLKRTTGPEPDRRE